jgi:exonuclease III
LAYNENCTDYKLDNFSFVSTNKNKKKGGGIGMFISNDLNLKFRPDLDINEEGIIESLFIEIITTVGKNIIVGTLYRPPNGKFEIFETNLNKILSKVDKSNKVTYFMGDFNIDLLKSESCDFSNRFSEQFFTSSFFPLITRPTRITEHTAMLIDIIIYLKNSWFLIG